MWKKDEGQTARPAAASAPRTEASGRAMAASGRATIGPSISIRGEVTGSEDLLIQGQVDGSVTLELHSVTVGSEGRVKANIIGRVIAIEGKVEGDLTAQEQILLRSTAHVLGDIRAPRLALEDGATFRGLVDMSAPPAKGKAAEVAPDAKATADAPIDKDGNGATGAHARKAAGTGRDIAETRRRAAT